MEGNDNSNSNSNDHHAVQESQIRKMTRLAIHYGAVNLSQGFPNQSPPWGMKLALAHGVLTGRPFEGSKHDDDDKGRGPATPEEQLEASLVEILRSHGATTTVADDLLNQYSPPCGRIDLRSAIADYYRRFYGYDSVDPENVTVTLGATEALASALRTLGRPGDKCVVFEPFHELYPSQCRLFYLEPVYVTLRPSSDGDNDSSSDNDNDSKTKTTKTEWKYDPEELERAMIGARILVLNTPHNPTGKVFSRDELAHIAKLCIQHDVYLVTDDIYEHVCFGTSEQEHEHEHEHDNTYCYKPKHLVVPQEFSEMADRTLMCNSLGKSASATGWRLGWCVHPSHLRNTYRGIHDQLAVMSPHPVQYATLAYLRLPDPYFEGLATLYGRKVTRLASALASCGFGVLPPQGAYYLFVEYKGVPSLAGRTSEEAAMYLLEDVGVACVPGDNFYGKTDDPTTRNRYLRFAACRSDADLDKAILLLQTKLGTTLRERRAGPSDDTK
eukprot:jgi/Psemu1/321216/estExt_fgenesh1_pm.C_16910001